MKNFLCVGVIFAGLSFLDADGQTLTMSVVPLSSTVVIGQPIVLRCAFSNPSEAGVELKLGDYDAEAVSFKLNPKLLGEKELHHHIHRGGYVLSTTETILPRQTSYRFILLDQWYQPSSVGAFQFEMIVHQKSGDLADVFTLNVENSDDSRLLDGVDTLLTRFEPFRKNRGTVSIHEVHSYEQTVLLALSYLPLRSEKFLDQLKSRYQNDTYTLRLINDAKVMGPSGRALRD